MTVSLQAYLDNLEDETYELMVGTGDSNALSYGFTQKRAVHPGVSGQMIPPPMAPQKWVELMEQEPDMSRKRMVYIHIPFCSHICLYCGFFQNFINEDREQRYVERLLKELEMAK